MNTRNQSNITPRLKLKNCYYTPHNHCSVFRNKYSSYHIISMNHCMKMQLLTDVKGVEKTSFSLHFVIFLKPFTATKGNQMALLCFNQKV